MPRMQEHKHVSWDKVQLLDMRRLVLLLARFMLRLRLGSKDDLRKLWSPSRYRLIDKTTIKLPRYYVDIIVSISTHKLY